MNILRVFEDKLSEFIDSENQELILDPDETMVIFSFSEEYEKVLNELPKRGIGNIIVNLFGKKDIYIGGNLESKKGKHFLEMYKLLADESSIYMSMARISSVKFDENEILNKIFVDLKKINLFKHGEKRMILKKENR